MNRIVFLGLLLFSFLSPAQAGDQKSETDRRLEAIEKRVEDLFQLFLQQAERKDKRPDSPAVKEAPPQETGDLRERCRTLEKEVESWRNRCGALENLLEQAKSSLVEMEKKWNETQANGVALAEKVEGIMNQLAETQRQDEELSETLRKAVEEREKALEALERERNKEPWPPILTHPPGRDEEIRLIEGIVTGVSTKVHLVVINVGEEGGVRVGFECTIFHGSTYVGALIVERVYPSQAACRLLLDRTRDRVQPGDRVFTIATVALPAEPPAEPGPIVETPMPDGRVTRADIEQGYAYIDLGSKDGVRTGMRFFIYSVLKGGGRKDKGVVCVIRVEKDFSQCSILRMADEGDPIVMGDYIWNKFFVRGRKLVFAFIGKFGGDNVKYTRDQLKKVIEDAGHIASDQIHADTKYVVLGEEYESDPQFKLVEDWRIEKITPNDLFESFGSDRSD